MKYLRFLEHSSSGPPVEVVLGITDRQAASLMASGEAIRDGLPFAEVGHYYPDSRTISYLPTEPSDVTVSEDGVTSEHHDGRAPNVADDPECDDDAA